MLRPRLARICDWLFFALIGLALAIELTGGIRIGRGWYRLTATDPARLLLVAAGVIVLRHLLLRHPSLRERLTARRARRRESWAVDGPLSSSVTRGEWLIAVGVMAVATGWLLQDQIATITGVLDRGDPFFSMWRLAWIAHQLGDQPAAAVEREHLPSGNEHVRLFGRDAAPWPDRRAVPLARRAARGRARRPVRRVVLRGRADDVRARPRGHGRPGAGARRRPPLRLLSVPHLDLQPPRDAGRVPDAARALLSAARARARSRPRRRRARTLSRGADAVVALSRRLPRCRPRRSSRSCAGRRVTSRFGRGSAPGSLRCWSRRPSSGRTRGRTGRRATSVGERPRDETRTFSAEPTRLLQPERDEPALRRRAHDRHHCRAAALPRHDRAGARGRRARAAGRPARGHRRRRRRSSRSTHRSASTARRSRGCSTARRRFARFACRRASGWSWACSSRCSPASAVADPSAAGRAGPRTRSGSRSSAWPRSSCGRRCR